MRPFFLFRYNAFTDLQLSSTPRFIEFALINFYQRNVKESKDLIFKVIQGRLLKRVTFWQVGAFDPIKQNYHIGVPKFINCYDASLRETSYYQLLPDES